MFQKKWKMTWGREISIKKKDNRVLLRVCLHNYGIARTRIIPHVLRARNSESLFVPLFSKPRFGHDSHGPLVGHLSQNSSTWHPRMKLKSIPILGLSLPLSGKRRRAPERKWVGSYEMARGGEKGSKSKPYFLPISKLRSSLFSSGSFHPHSQSKRPPERFSGSSLHVFCGTIPHLINQKW